MSDKYTLRIQRYVIGYLNLNPEIMSKTLLQVDATANVNQFKSYVYADLVYSQNAFKYTYPAAAPAAPLPASYPAN